MAYEYPGELFEGAPSDPELLARMGRFAILKEMGFFGDEANTSLALNVGGGTWMSKVIRRFSNTYGDMAGCHPADIEVAGEYLGVFDDVFDVEVTTRKYVGDR